MPINQFSNVSYSWVPAGTSKANNFTAQNVFKAATTTAPGFVAQGTGTISAIPTVDANAVGLFQGTEAVAGHVFFSSSGATTHVVFRRNNGTYASPTALAANDIIGSLQWQGRGASTFGTVPAAQIRGVATQAFTESARGTQIEVYVTAQGTITQNQVFVFDPTLSYSLVPLQGFSSVRSTGNAGTIRDFRLTTATSLRWSFIANATAESSTATGSDFELRRYNNSGVDLGVALGINRATGVTTLGADRVNLSTAITGITTSGSAGTTGDIAWDDTYLYVRMSTGWRRIALGAAF